MKNLKYIALLALALFVVNQKAEAQLQEDLIQFSGMVLDGTEELLAPIPYTNIIVKGKGRGTYSDFTGFFSIVVEKGDVIEFSAVGYRSETLTIPDSLNDTRYSLVQILSRDTINLPVAVIFPWPSRDHFRLEFLAMDVTSEMQRRAVENVAEESLARMRNEVGMDGNENADFYLRQQASNYYYIGQTPPMNIFNPIAWKQFFDAWKRGDFKKKRLSSDPLNIEVGSVEELPQVVPRILERVSDSGIVLFQGEIGAGKTTLIQQICKHLGVNSAVTSPTFSLVNEYNFQKDNGQAGRIFHLDLYRIEDPEELIHIGFEDYLYEGDFCFIEWPEIANDLLPDAVLRLQLEHDVDSGRKILFL